MSNNFHGYDLSRLLGNAVEVKTAPKEKLITEQSMELDVIDVHIKNRDLDNHPECLKAILKELDLSKFWKQLTTTPEVYNVFTPLAVNRMLNFFEGATVSGMGRNDIRIGMVVSALTSTFICMEQGINPKINPLVYSPCFMSLNQLDLSSFDLSKMSEVAKDEVLYFISQFNSGEIAQARIKNRSSVGTYLVNSMKMWLVSDDTQVLKIMAKDTNRHLFINGSADPMTYVYIGAADVSAFKYDKLMAFSTPWATGKIMMRNVNKRYLQIKQTYATTEV